MRRHAIAFYLLLFTIALTFFLITWGGIVKSSGSSLGCPDWPLCYGQMIPDASYLSEEAARQLFWEYGHRLLGASVGVCSILLLALLWGGHPTQGSLRGPAAFLLGLVIFQGLLGGMTVLHAEGPSGQTSPVITTFHLGTSLLVLLLEVWLAREAWLRRRAERTAAVWPAAAARSVLVVVGAGLLLIYLQIILGAVVRHSGATWAAGTGPRAAFLGVDPETGVFMLFSSEPFAMLNLLHRYFAIGVATVVALTGIWCWMRVGRIGGAAQQALVWLAPALVVFQILVGIGMIAMSFDLMMRTMHLSVAAALLMAQFLLWIELLRASRGADPADAADR